MLTSQPCARNHERDAHSRRDGALGRQRIRPPAEESGLAPPPKEQPPWKLSGTKDRRGDDSLESEGLVPSTDGVGSPAPDIRLGRARERNLLGPMTDRALFEA